jgi:hypothetical protein
MHTRRGAVEWRAASGGSSLSAYDAIALARFDAEGTTLQGMLDQVRSLPGVFHALAAPRLTHVEAVGVTAA